MRMARRRLAQLSKVHIPKAALGCAHCDRPTDTKSLLCMSMSHLGQLPWSLCWTMQDNAVRTHGQFMQ